MKKEEQKQLIIDMMKGDEELGLYDEPKQENCCTPIGQIKRYIDCKGCDRKPKQEITLEEAAEILYPYDGVNEDYKIDSKRWSFIAGAKWQAERMYSDEDINKQIEDFKHDLMESNSHYVKLLCDGAIFGFNRLKSIKL
jgi:hypothetical protein